ncbi:MAG: biotin synthase BioB [Mycobacteriales bacterium]
MSPSEVLAAARAQVLADGVGLTRDQAQACLQLPDTDLPALLELAHEVRLRWCGPAVEVEGIVSVKTGGCPEDCHFCSQSGRFDSPVRAARLDVAELVEAAVATAATGATEFCIVAAVRGPDRALLDQVADGIRAIRSAVDINVACSLGILTPEQVAELVDLGVHRYNHNLETARSFFPTIVTTHTYEERWRTCELVRDTGIQLCCGGILGLGESVAQRAEFAVELAELAPDEVPLNFLNPRPGTPLADQDLLERGAALRAIAMFRLEMPRTLLRLAGGRELTLGAEGAVAGLLGGVNAVIAGNYLTTLGRPAGEDLGMLTALDMPIRKIHPDRQENAYTRAYTDS